MVRFFLGTSLFLRIECLCGPLSFHTYLGLGFHADANGAGTASSISYLFSACFCLFIFFHTRK